MRLNLRDAFSGAPIFSGRWQAIICFWISGELIGDMDIGLVWGFVPDSVAHVGHKHYMMDLFMGLMAVFFLILGVINLDRYGRNCWFAWAPDDAEWGGVTRVEHATRDSSYL